MMTVSTPGVPAASMMPTRYGVKMFFHLPGMLDISTTRWRSAHWLTGMGRRRRKIFFSPLEKRMLILPPCCRR